MKEEDWKYSVYYTMTIYTLSNTEIHITKFAPDDVASPFLFMLPKNTDMLLGANESG